MLALAQVPLRAASRAMAVKPSKEGHGGRKPKSTAVAAMSSDAEAEAAEAQRAKVAADYAAVVNNSGGCCVSSTDNRSAIGYTSEDLAKVGGADLGVGCGTPVRLAQLKPGETVMDLGCGAGIDCLLAADDVGPTGSVVGVDMTPDMLAKAREGARERGLLPPRVEFRLGEIENLPAGDNTVDAVISNCVINLSPDKPRVLREALRVLKPGGEGTREARAVKERERAELEGRAPSIPPPPPPLFSAKH